VHLFVASTWYRQYVKKSIYFITYNVVNATHNLPVYYSYSSYLIFIFWAFKMLSKLKFTVLLHRKNCRNLKT